MLNMKGGVGKTTLAVNMASCLAKLEDKRVLLIDLDPQYNATQYLVNLEKHPEFVNGTKPTVFDIMAAGMVSATSIANGSKVQIRPRRVKLDDVKRTLYENDDGEGLLDLIPGTLHLINVEISRELGIENKLQRFVKGIDDAYEFIIIDCPPTFSIFLLSGFLASDFYLIPLKPDPLSTLGVPLLERVLNVYSDTYGKEIQPLGVVFTMVRDTREMHDVMEDIRDTSAGKRYIFRNILSMSTRVAEASRKNLALFEYREAARYGKEIRDITDEFLKLF
jgi:chromosome partitioning protein